MDKHSQQLVKLASILKDFYEPEEMVTWLIAKHPLLDDRTPMQMIMADQGDAVISVAEGLNTGTYH